MAFAGAWLFEEFSRASGAYRLFYPCGLLEKPYTMVVNTIVLGAKWLFENAALRSLGSEFLGPEI